MKDTISIIKIKLLPIPLSSRKYLNLAHTESNIDNWLISF